MKVAIIGGGLAGIVCAVQLERMGIMPDVFERNSDLGESYRHVGAALEIALRPIRDPLQYLSRNYNISFKPSGLVKKIVHKSPSACTAITGDLGYFLYRGAIPDSIDNQMARSLKSRIFLNTDADFRELEKDYDYVVVATGNPFEARSAGIWRDVIKMSIKGAVVSGDFSTDTFTVWLNKDYCKSGYAYLAPFNEREASLALAVNEIGPGEMDKYWDRFIKTENIRYKVEEYFDRVHYSGFVYPHTIGNVYFIGNAGGVLDPLLGFGVFPTVVTASEAAWSIADGGDYECRIRNVVKMNRRMLEFRKTFNILDNKGYDLLVRSIGLPGANTLIYRSKLINVVTMGYSTLKPFNSLIQLGKRINLFRNP